MSKFWLSGDWHLDKKNIKLQKEGFVLPLLQHAFLSIEELKPSKVVLLGDIFHSKDLVSSTLSKLFGEFLLKVGKLDFIDEIVLLIGNHDFSMVSEETYYHAYWSYKNFEKVTVVDDYYKITDNIGCISFCREQELFYHRKKLLGKVDCLLLHQDLKGFLKGDDYIEEKFLIKPESLTNKLTILGHYHTPQEKEIKGNKYVYCGSFESTTFGESDDEKSIILLDSDSLEYERYPTGMTFHKTLKINVDEELPIIPQEDLDKGVLYRVIVKGTKEEFDLKNIPREYSRKVKVIPDFIKSKRKRVQLKSTDTIETTFEKYTKEEIEKNYASENFNIEELIKEGLLLYQKGKKKRLG